MAWGYLLLHKTFGEDEYLGKAMQSLEWLDRNAEAGHVGHCWGNHFDFSTRGGRMKAHTPTIVWSGLIGQAFLEAYEQTAEQNISRSQEYLSPVLDLPRETLPRKLPKLRLGQSSVHNSNLLGAAAAFERGSTTPVNTSK